MPHFSSSSSGVIADPYVPPPESGGPSLATAAGYRYRYGRLKGGLKSTYAAAKMRQKFDDFEPTTIGNIAEDMFTSLHTLYKKGRHSKLDAIATDTFAASLKKGVKQNWALTSTFEHPLEFVRLGDPAKLLQMRLVPVDEADRDKIFAQCTLKINCEMKRSTKMKLPTAKTKAIKEGAAVGEWREALDNESGRTYYWHTGTKQARWDRPAAYGQYGSARQATETFFGAGTDNDIQLEDEADLVYNVSSYVVLERAFHIPYSQWRICKL